MINMSLITFSIKCNDRIFQISATDGFIFGKGMLKILKLEKYL